MKYRSIGIFAILIAALAAFPQASQELGALRDSASALLRAELGNAFLSLQDRADRSVESRGSSSSVMDSEAPCEKPDEALAAAKKSRAKDRRLDNGVRRFDLELGKMLTDPVHVELARMITDPTFHPGQKSAPKSKSSFIFADLGRGIPMVELAQLSSDAVSTFPVEAVSSQSRVATTAETTNARRTSRVRSRSDSESSEAAYEISIDADEARREALRVREEISREVRARGTSKSLNSLKPIEGFFKFVKVKQRNAGVPAAPVAPSAVKDLSCDDSLKMFEAEAETK